MENSSSNLQLAEINRKLDILLDDRQKIENLELRIDQLESTGTSKNQEYQVRLQAKNEEIQRLRNENIRLKSQLGISTVVENTGSLEEAKKKGANYKRNLKKKNKQKSKKLEPKETPMAQDPSQMMMNIFSQFPGFGIAAKNEEVEDPGLRELNLKLKNEEEEEDDATYFARLRKILEDEKVQGAGAS